MLVLSACSSDSSDSSSGTTDGGSGDCTASDDVKGESGGLLASLQEAGTVEVGIANEVPYGYEAEDGESRRGPEVARAVLREMGIGGSTPRSSTSAT